jgi:hypothetical protein
MTRHFTWLAALGIAGLSVLAACGGGSGNAAQVASLAGDDNATTTTTTAGDGASSEEEAQQAMLDFARCMREHGVDMPDPQFSEDGKGEFVAGGPGGETDKTKLDEAKNACQSYLDKARSNAPPPDPAQVEEEKQKLLAFAQCMRDHGIDFPDPQISTDGGGIQVQMGGPNVDPESPAFQEASEACASEVGMPKFGPRAATGAGGADDGSSTGADGEPKS